jgi:hypothetical protein
MTIYFVNCLGACNDAAIEVAGDATFGLMIDAARAKWGEGTLIRQGQEYVWRKQSDRDGDWRGCCARKMGGPQ